MISVIKDIISICFYVLFCPFQKSKNAILVYHSIGRIDKDKDPLKINVDTALFDKHMMHIGKMKQKYLVTFDDGYESVYLNAFPIIKRYGIRSIVFLTTDYLDGRIKMDNFFDNGYSPKPLTWDQAKEMGSCGIRLGSHSITHKSMAGLDGETAYLEALASKKRILDMTGYDVNSFAYPFGYRRSFNEKTENDLRSAGYKKAYTNILGMDNSEIEPFTIKRIRIYNTDGMFRFRMKICGAYNWVDVVLGIFKKARD